MNHEQVLQELAEFSEFGECVVIKQSDWDNLVRWVENLASKNASEEDRPNFNILPILFEKEE